MSLSRTGAALIVFALLTISFIALLQRSDDQVLAQNDVASNCAGSGSAISPHQYARNETAAGVLQCALLDWLSLTNIPTACVANQFVQSPTASSLGCAGLASVAWSLLTSFPSACTGSNFVQGVGAALTCVAVAQEAASSPAACSAGNFLTRVTEASDGSLTFTCVADNAAEVASSPAACPAGQELDRVTEAADGSLTLTCGAGTNTAFSSNTSTCTISSATANLGAFTTAPTYTTQGSNFLHTLSVTLNFEIDPPAVANINTQYTFAYGTGSAPACATANAGTSVGNTYTVIDIGETGAGSFQGKWPESVTVAITGLAASTTYWFDLKITDSSTASWVFLKPQITVTEI